MSRVDQPAYSTFRISTMTLLLLLFVGALSLLSLYLGFDAFLSDHTARASIYLVMGASGFALIGYMFFRSKSVAERVETIPKMEVSTTLECKSCGLKKIRPFQRGEYLFKEAEECGRCKGKMFVERIYGREKIKAR